MHVRCHGKELGFHANSGRGGNWANDRHNEKAYKIPMICFYSIFSTTQEVGSHLPSNPTFHSLKVRS